MCARLLLVTLVLAIAVGCDTQLAAVVDASAWDAGVDAPDRVVGDAGPVDAAPRPDASPSSPSGPLGLSDVSTLFPLPATLASSSLLALDAEGAGGPLLSQAQFDDLAAFDPTSGPVDAELAYARFRVVAMRIDPCFPTLSHLDTDPASCRRQIRLVAQALYDGASGVRARDAALHLLYDVSADELDVMVHELVAMRGARAFDPAEILGVHPVLAAEGDSGPHGAMLRAWILSHAGASTLSQVTFLHGDGNFSWRFGGLRFVSGAPLPLRIEAIDSIVAPEDADSQSAALDPGLSGPMGNTTGVSSVSPTGPRVRSIEALFGIRRMSMGMPYWEYPSDADVSAAIGAAYRIESPLELDASNVDCVSCHIAGAARQRAELLGHTGDLGYRYRSGWDLTRAALPTVTARPNVVRAFGYFDTTPAISQRTINESAAVADRIDATL